MKLKSIYSSPCQRSSAQRASARWFSRFRQDENGSLIIFSLFMFVLILWLSGLAVDLIRFETTRAKLQGTLDRATLAAADLDQTLDCESVVEDYFEKAGMLAFLEEIDCDTGPNFRVVTADAEVDLPLFFYDIPRVFTDPFDAGLSTLNVSGVSTAEERVSDVEVSLILDVSSSMNSNNRITNLRPAARDFVTTVLANNTNAPHGLITISMVPYSAVVNVGTDIEPHLNINRTHIFSTCPLFEQDVWFETTELDLSISYDHVSHFDPDWFFQDPSPIEDPWCPVDDHNAIVPVTSDVSALHDAIDDLDPYGNTAIDMGMKWGVGLLDPSTRSIVTTLAATAGNSVDTTASGRPNSHTEEEIQKIIVLMTDGQNTRQYDLFDRFKTGTSFIWFDISDDPTRPLHQVNDNDISVQYSGQLTPDNYDDDLFFWNGNGTWGSLRQYPRGYSSLTAYRNARLAGVISTATVGVGPTYSGQVRNATWQELYANWEHNRIDNELTGWAFNRGVLPWSAGTGVDTNGDTIFLPDHRDPSNALNTNLVNSIQADARLSDLCQAARDQGIVIYTVAFEAPSSGQTALQDCATSDSHYFDVDGTDISVAFGAIASDIRALKLTQ